MFCAANSATYIKRENNGLKVNLTSVKMWGQKSWICWTLLIEKKQQLHNTAANKMQVVLLQVQIKKPVKGFIIKIT